MKLLITLFFAVLSLSISAQTSQYITENQRSTAATKLLVDIDGDVKIVATRGSRVRIETTVSINTTSEAIVNVVKKSNRHSLSIVDDSNTETLSITYTKPTKILMVKGKELQESISCIIYVPETILYVE